jgi:hypothetical protein
MARGGGLYIATLMYLTMSKLIVSNTFHIYIYTEMFELFEYKYLLKSYLIIVTT